MAEAGPSSSVALASAPLHHVASANHSDLAVFLSANSIQLIQQRPSASGDANVNVQNIPTDVIVPQPVKPDQSDAARYAEQPHITFARIAAFSPSDRFLALTGDDKVLRVWRLDTDASDGSITGFGFGKEVLIKHLPKRAAILHWMNPVGSQSRLDKDAAEELIVVDRFGDVRSFILDSTSSYIPPTVAAATAASASTSTQPTDDEQDQMDSPTDPSMQILLGHVSMVTALEFIPHPTPGKVPPFVVTSDRDEHIRISRWGSKRLGYVIERFLQGSRSFVGALAVVPDGAGSHCLVSSDGGDALRVWALPEAQAGASKAPPLSSEAACISINTIGSALAPYVLARDREERRREAKLLQASSKRAQKQKRKQQESGANTTADEPAKPRAADYSKNSKPTIVISRLVPFQMPGAPAGEAQLLIVAEGATALFHIPLQALLKAVEPNADGSSGKQRDLADQVRVAPTATPVLDVALRQSSSTDVSLIATFDTRDEFQPSSDSPSSTEAQLFTFSSERGAFQPTASLLVDSILPATVDDSSSSAGSARAKLDASQVENQSLYPSLTTWPKIEVPSSAEIIANRTTRKGRFNHPLNTSLIGVAPTDQASSSADAADADADSDESHRQKLVKTMQGGKRERGRERNREAIRLAAEKAGVQ
ncbi:hypothetical protein BCV70DRAFT_42281 [Testicularia cyperi]|uniref:Uncharacterized protein n=1 Tax=Testicularia cyperi TaxID=1882483 RepID=A0A317XJ55_9BASI|nr:hypothetical protein BCV70DRAFT_42281 [Testicularia cyperi]